MDILSLFMTALIGLVGVAVGYGALKNMASRNTTDIDKISESVDNLSTKFVPQTECTLKHQQLVGKLEIVQSTVVDQQRTTRRLVNFAIHELTSDGMSLADAQNILENGKA